MTFDCPAWVSLHRRYRYPASKLGIARIGRLIVPPPRSGQTWRFLIHATWPARIQAPNPVPYVIVILSVRLFIPRY